MSDFDTLMNENDGEAVARPSKAIDSGIRNAKASRNRQLVLSNSSSYLFFFLCLQTSSQCFPEHGVKCNQPAQLEFMVPWKMSYC